MSLIHLKSPFQNLNKLFKNHYFWIIEDFMFIANISRKKLRSIENYFWESNLYQMLMLYIMNGHHLNATVRYLNER